MEERRRRAIKKYNSKHITFKCIAINDRTDQDIIKHLKTIPNFSGYIHELIREDIKKGD